MRSRNYTVIDRAVMALDSCLANLTSSDQRPETRPGPADKLAEPDLNEPERRHSAGLMRVNHAGEVAAQALYKAQGLTATDISLRQAMRQAAAEEIDHLEWCESRLEELGGHTSYLGPAWFAGAFGIGFFVGLLGDKCSLGFLAETEHQVVRHLDEQLDKLPEKDIRSRAILQQMRADELRHATNAELKGAGVLPKGIKRLMYLASRVMTGSAYYV